jgi:hypothetical protein
MEQKRINAWKADDYPLLDNVTWIKTCKNSEPLSADEMLQLLKWGDQQKTTAASDREVAYG